MHIALGIAPSVAGKSYRERPSSVFVATSYFNVLLMDYTSSTHMIMSPF